MKNRGDLTISRNGKALSRLLDSIRRDANEAVTGYFAPVMYVAKNIGTAFGATAPRHAKTAYNKRRKRL